MAAATILAQGAPGSDPWDKTRTGGFSLLEVVVALSIMAIVSAIAIPNFSALAALYRLTSGSQLLVTEIQRARMRAVGRNMYYRVQFGNSVNSSTSITTGIYWLEYSEAGSTFTLDGSVRSLPTGIYFSTLPPAPVTFNRQGLSLANTTLAVANRLGSSRTLVVNPAGRITFQ